VALPASEEGLMLDAKPTAAQLAISQQIAADLFHDGSDRKADRLVMEHVIKGNKMFGGGWCEQAVADRIALELARHGWHPSEQVK
jgi:hypothetical protein